MTDNTNTPAPKLIEDQSTGAQTEVEQPTADAKPIVNSQKLPWPQDTAGITSRFKREACRAVGRMGGKVERLKLIKEVLEVINAYADAKFEQQVVNNKRLIKERAEKRAKEVLQREKEARAYAEDISKQAAALTAEAKAINDRIAEAKSTVDT